ncbi:protein kinase [Frankia sp. Cj3]|uniref:protein kinase domain-containing protein n=1 Tax=Frankia sp. Cj3 TaxID=2880976 RepID=UPI001EF4A5E9|nr:protein kinase [Frankia sp. Cj3]
MSACGGVHLVIINEAQVAEALPSYELGAKLGAGAFGLVLAGRHRDLDRNVAIKVLSPAQENAPGGFKAEARILAAMDHPHVVRVYDYVEADELHLIVMELLGGGTLTRRRAGIPPEGACAVGLAVAAALTCAHAQGVLHRDIKPDNILFDTGGLLKVTDFGIAKIFDGSAATASMLIGTPKYMAPEQLVGGRLGPPTDLYALGVLLYELLVGTPLFDPALSSHALGYHHLYSPPPPLVGVPAPVAEAVLRALAKDPAARQPSAHAFALDLAAAAARGYGPRWTARAGIGLRLADDVRDAADLLVQPSRQIPAPIPRPPGPQPAVQPSSPWVVQPPPAAPAVRPSNAAYQAVPAYPPSPGQPNPGYQSPGQPNPGYQSPGQPNPGYQSPGQPNPGYQSPGQPNPGYQSPGQQQSAGYQAGAGQQGVPGYQAGPGYPPSPGYYPASPAYPAPPGYAQRQYDVSAPFGRDPVTGEPYSDKQKLVAGLLQIFLGVFGAGRWYLGDTAIALAQLFTCGGFGVWALIDGVLMLTGNVRDVQGRPLRD